MLSHKPCERLIRRSYTTITFDVGFYHELVREYDLHLYVSKILNSEFLGFIFKTQMLLYLYEL